MPDNEAKIRVVADATAVKPGVDKAKGEMSELVPLLQQLNERFDVLAGEMRNAFTAGTNAARAMEAQISEVSSEVRRNGEAMRGTFDTVTGAIKGMLVYLSGREAIDFSQRMGDAAEKTQLLSQRLGIATADVQRLGAIADVTQSNVDTMAGAMAKLDKSFAAAKGGGKEAAAAFSQIGVDLNGSYTQMELFQTAMAKFAEMADGPSKVALAMQLFGRTGAELIPILSLSQDQLSELNGKLATYGVVSDQAVAAGNDLADAWDDNTLAMRGLENALTEALAPLLTQAVEGFNGLVKAMVDSYHAGGTVKQVFDMLVASGQVAMAVVTALSPIVVALAENIQTLMAIASLLATLMAVDFVRGMVAAAASTALAETAIFAMQARAIGAATTMEALGLIAATTGRTLLAALGGPVGIALAVLTVGMIALVAATGDAAHASEEFARAEAGAQDEYKKSADLADRLATSHGKVREALLAEAQARLVNLRTMAAEAQGKYREALGNYQTASDDYDRAKAQPGLGGSYGAQATYPAKARAEANLNSANATALSFQQQIAVMETAIKAPEIASGFGTTSGISSGGGTNTPAKSRFGDWEKDLEELKLAWAQAQDAQGSAIEYSAKAEADYWQKILDGEKMSKEERLSVLKAYLAAHSELTKQSIDEQIAKYQTELDEAKGNTEERKRIATEEAEFVLRKYGAQSTQYQAAQRQLTQILREGAEERRRIEEENARRVEEIRLRQLDAEEDVARLRTDLGLRTEAQLLAILRDGENKRYAATMARLDTSRSNVRPGDLAAAAALDKQVEQLRSQHQTRLTQIDRQATLARTQIQRQAIASVSQLWGQQIGRLLTLQQGFVATIRGLYTGMASIVGNVLASIIEKWLTTKLTAVILGGAMDKAAKAAEITSAAAVAGANAFASTAAIPVVGPALAPAAAAGAVASTMSFMGMLAVAPYAQGAQNLSEDQLAFVHKGETIIPAAEAGGWRNIMALFASIPSLGLPDNLSGSLASALPAANTNAPEAANDTPSGMTLNYHDHTARGMTHEQIMSNRSSIAKALIKAHREGAFVGTGITL